MKEHESTALAARVAEDLAQHQYTQQVHMCGNSLSPPPMAALARANDPWRIAERQAAAA